MKKPNIVCIGGGTGQSVVLKGLSKYPFNITAIVGVTDNGGHSGVLRRALNIPQVGDIRNCITALADKDNTLSQLIQYRFSEGKLEGVNLGNMIFACLIRITGSLYEAINEISRMLDLSYRVIPVSNGYADICATLVNGKTICGEWEIIKRKPRTAIKQLFHKPIIPCLSECKSAIKKADTIIFCPGSLQTGIISTLLVKGVRETIRNSKATLIQICNIMTQPGLTDRFTDKDHIQLLSKYLGRKPDHFIINTEKPPPILLKIYNRSGSTPVESDSSRIEDVKIITTPLVEHPSKKTLALYHRSGKGLLAGPHYIRHDADKLATTLISIIKASI